MARTGGDRRADEAVAVGRRPSTARIDPGDLARTWWPVVVATVTATGLGLALAPVRPADDAAILLRYAERIGTGQGFTYNDHERVLGASAGLWTLLLGGLRALGAPVVGTAAALGVASYAAAVGLSVRLAQRLAGPVAAVVAGAVLLTTSGFRGWSLSGLESGLAAALGVAAVLAVVEDRERLAGVLVGLALWNKLDAVALLAALSVSWWWVRHRPPTRLVAWATLVVAPYLVFCTVWFGSPVPASVTAKAGGRADGPEWNGDPLWVLRSLSGLAPAGVLAVVGLARGPVGLLGPGRAPDSRRIAVATLAGWAFVHAVAISVVPAGAEYPWYLAVLHPPLAILAGLGATVALRRLRRSTPPAGQRVVAGALLIGLALTVAYPVASTLRDRPLSAHDVRFDREMPAALAWMGPRVAPGEVVRTCFGAPALALPQATIDDPCGLTSERAPRPAVWEVTTLAPGPSGRWEPPSGTCVAHAPADVAGDPVTPRIVVLRRGPPESDGRC